MDFLANIVQQVLTVLYNFTESIGIPNLGLAIVLMTIIIKLIMYPLTQKQIQSTKAMMEIQPKMKALQEKYKDDKQRLNMELANLYKSEGVNPLAGCLPLLIQMPIMIGIFYGIRDYNYAAHPEIVTSFLWLADISKADPTYVLPVRSALTSRGASITPPLVIALKPAALVLTGTMHIILKVINLAKSCFCCVFIRFLLIQ